MRCWNCANETDLDGSTIGFNAVCPTCASYLHACKGCRNFSSRHDDGCDHPQAEYVGEKQHRNLCEFFIPLASLASPSTKDTQKFNLMAAATKKKKTEVQQRFDQLFS